MYDYAKRLCVKERTNRDEKSEPVIISRSTGDPFYQYSDCAFDCFAFEGTTRLVFGIDAGKSAAGRL